jgi:hypothetical protein
MLLCGHMPLSLMCQLSQPMSRLGVGVLREDCVRLRCFVGQYALEVRGCCALFLFFVSRFAEQSSARPTVMGVMSWILVAVLTCQQHAMPCQAVPAGLDMGAGVPS